jgi:hypothetical protein
MVPRIMGREIEIRSALAAAIVLLTPLARTVGVLVAGTIAVGAIAEATRGVGISKNTAGTSAAAIGSASKTPKVEVSKR